MLYGLVYYISIVHYNSNVRKEVYKLKRKESI